MTEFDALAGQTFEHISNLMGEDAVWLASKFKLIHGQVLYKDPTEPVQIGEAESYEYRPSTAAIEYYAGTFAGLKQAVDAGNEEFISVRDRKYMVQSIATKFDGKTYVASLDLHED